MNARAKKIHWDVLILMIGGTLIPGETFFLVACAYLLCLVFRNHMRLVVPNLAGFRLYLCVIGYALFAGLFLYELRAVVRDLYYLLSTVVWIWIGSLIAYLDRRHRKGFYQTLFLYGGFASLKTMAAFFLDFSMDFDHLRSIFTQHVYDVGFIMPMALVQMVFFGCVFVNRAADALLVLLMAAHILLSFGRAAIFQTLLFLFCAMAVAAASAADRRKAWGKTAGILLGAAAVLLAGLCLVPDEVSFTFLDKVVYSFREMDPQQAVRSVESAMQNWRGYEIRAARQQWLGSPLVVQLLGSGLGKGIEIQYIPYHWENMVENNAIPLLHNGFYTMLIKGGLLGVAALAAMFGGPLLKGLRWAKSRAHEKKAAGYILAGASAAAFANTYVVRGPVQQGAFLVWALLIGWLTESMTLQAAARTGAPPGRAAPHEE